MLKWNMNKFVVFAAVFAIGMILPSGMASAGSYYGVHIGYGHHYGGHYGYNYGHHYGGHEGYGYGHHGGDDDHEAYERHGYTPHHSYYNSYPYTYGYSSYPHEIRIYSHQQNASIARSGDGWALLKSNHPTDALNAFALAAQEYPNKGTPKVGYALASAATGQLDRGVWAMRRALRFDSDALRYVVVDHILEHNIRQLIRRYEYNTASAKMEDAAFMRASLHYLLRESSLARSALGQTAYTREDTLSTKNLKQLIYKNETRRN